MLGEHDFTVLAREVANFASLRLSSIARWVLAAIVRVEVAVRGVAAAAGVNWAVVYVVHC